MPGLLRPPAQLSGRACAVAHLFYGGEIRRCSIFCAYVVTPTVQSGFWVSNRSNSNYN